MKNWRDKMEEALRSAEIDDADKPEYCEYIYHDGLRYCKVTTQKSCKKCRFFSPNLLKRMEIVASHYERLEAEIAKLKLEKKKAMDRIGEQSLEIKALRKDYSCLKEFECSDRKRCGPNDEHFDKIVFNTRKGRKKNG